MQTKKLQESIAVEFAQDERLFHYTSAQGLYGILDSGCVWATHYQFLNDNKELQAARSSLENFLGMEFHKAIVAYKVNNSLAVKPGSDLKAAAYEEAKKLIAFLYDVVLIIGAPYIFSTFCSSPMDGKVFSDGGLLHWSSYGRSGGYAIQINPHKLSPVMEAEQEQHRSTLTYLGRVAYGDEVSIPDLLHADFTTIATRARKFFEEGRKLEGENALNDARIKLFTDLGNEFISIVSFFKDKYFETEKEVRIIAMRSNTEAANEKCHTIAIRRAGATAIPYLRLFEDKLLGEDGPLERIIVGPHPENARRVIALKGYLNARGLRHVEVFESTVPYVAFSA